MSLTHLTVNDSHFAKAFSLTIQKDQHTVIVGGNGSGKAHLLAHLRSKLAQHYLVSEVSFEEQHALIEQERLRDDSDITDNVFYGTPLKQLLVEAAPKAKEEKILSICQSLGLNKLLSNGFRQLSSGETRKALLARALLREPDIILLYEPLSGIDQQSRQHIREMLQQAASHSTLILALNHHDEIIDTLASQLITIDKQGRANIHKTTDHAHIKHICKSLLNNESITTSLPLPPSENHRYNSGSAPKNNQKALIEMHNIVVRHNNRDILRLKNWQVMLGESWQIRGPNGSGKTTLLKLISGDHPQCYNNDIQLFGQQRGTGESIWEIKAKLGHMTSDLHWNYRVPGTALSVIISGIYDSIGLYHKVSETDKTLGQQWLNAIGMSQCSDTSFHQLSHGEQRLCLIARAMIKHPELLLLDEPCQGLDSENRQRVIMLIQQLIQSSNTSLIYVGHEDESFIQCINHSLTLSAIAEQKE